MTTATLHVGCDENGLGPRLGPMIVTAVMAEAAPGASRIATSRARGKLAQILGDSKGLVAHGDVALGQAWARALAKRGATRLERASDVAPGSVEELVDALCLDDRAVLTAPCPSHVAPQCWGTRAETFDDSDAAHMLEGEVVRSLDKLEARGVRIVRVRSVVVCTKLLNDAALAGNSRFKVDLHAMERLVLDLRGAAGADVHAVCGKVGGYGNYSDAFGPLSGRLHAVVEESRAKSTYRFPGVGELSFVRDADRDHLLVSMASLVGKWLREVLMSRIVAHYRATEDGVPVASGYHDPVTTRFVALTARARHDQRIPAECFERTKSA